MTTSASGTIYPMPFVRVEVAVLAVSEGALQVLLGMRQEAPYAGRWALPGGAVRIDLDADLAASCRRVAQERLGLDLPDATQFLTTGGRQRDPRSPWAMAVVYRAVTTPARLAAAPGKRLSALKWVDALSAAADPRLAFDHPTVIAHAIDSLRESVSALRFPPGLIEPPFTLADLQTVAAAVLGHRVDKASFRRRVEACGCVQPVPGALRTGPNRPAQLYALKPMPDVMQQGKASRRGLTQK